MTSRFVLPFADVGAGITPSSGAKLFFYETGTTTPKDTYSDSAGTIPNTNPVIANSLGVFPDIYISGAYKVVLKNSSDIQYWSADPVTDQIGTAVARNIGFVSDMVASTTISIGDILDTTGYYNFGDGGDNRYKVVAAATGTADGGSYIDLTGSGLQAEAMFPGGEIRLMQFGAVADGVTDCFNAFTNAIKYLSEGGEILLPIGELYTSGTIRDDALDPLSIGKTITLIGKGSNEDPINSGTTTIIKTIGAYPAIKFDGNRSGGRNFVVKGDGGAYDATASNIIVESSRAQWKNIVSLSSRGDGFKFVFGNSSAFENILCALNKGNGFNADGTGYIDKAGASKPNDLNAATLINLDLRANTLAGLRTGANSGFANNCYQLTVQGNGGVGAEFNGNFWNVYGFYGENNDSAGTGKDIRFSSTADVNTIYGQFSNIAPAWEDLSTNQRNYIEQYRTLTEEFHCQRVLLGEDTTPAGYIKIDGEGDAVSPTITLEGTSASQTVVVKSSGAGTLKFDFQDGILTEASAAPTLLNSWVNFGGTRKVAGYYKDALGIVHLEGVISSGTTTNPTLLFTLPAGYRPIGGRIYFSTTSNAAHASCFVETTGDVYYESGSNVSFALDGISFRSV